MSDILPRLIQLSKRVEPYFWLVVLDLLVISFVFPSNARADQSDPIVASAQVEMAQIYIPRLRSHVWAFPIYSGISDSELDLGIGWFPKSAQPGEVGNFSIVGHRTASRAPFYFFENLAVGDEVIIRTWKSWFVYQLTRQQVVTPHSTWVLDPIPKSFSFEEAAEPLRLITLMTCTPRNTSQQRWIWWGTLTQVLPPEEPPLSLISAIRRPSNLNSVERPLFNQRSVHLSLRY
jgi:sortase A